MRPTRVSRIVTLGEVAHVDLGRGVYALIDADAAPKAAGLNWRLVRTGKKRRSYAIGWTEATDNEYLHRYLLGLGPLQRAHFINGNSLDCRRENLEVFVRKGGLTWKIGTGETWQMTTTMAAISH